MDEDYTKANAVASFIRNEVIRADHTVSYVSKELVDLGQSMSAFYVIYDGRRFLVSVFDDKTDRVTDLLRVLSNMSS